MSSGHRQVVRNGYLPERTITTGIGPVEVEQPRVHDRRTSRGSRTVLLEDPAALPAEDQEHRGADPLAVPQGDQHRRLQRGLAGAGRARVPRACRPRRSPGSRKSGRANTRSGAKRSLKGKQYVYVWADGVHFNIRLEEDRQCILVLMGATADGQKELIAIADGYRESEQSWKELAAGREGPRPGRSIPSWPPATGRWASGRRSARSIPTTREQRCWVHKTANVLDKLPKRLQPEAKDKLHEIWMAETRPEAEQAFDLVRGDLRGEVPQGDASAWPRTAEVLLTFYDFPAEHWMHLRTTNPIESTFATVRLRHGGPRATAHALACLTMVFKLMQSAAKRWRLLNGSELLPDVIAGVQFNDGVKSKKPPPDNRSSTTIDNSSR